MIFVVALLLFHAQRQRTSRWLRAVDGDDVTLDDVDLVGELWSGVTGRA